jgi:hypothetical protein
VKHTWRLILGALCAAIAIGVLAAGPATAALSDGAISTTKVSLLDDDDVEFCIGHDCDTLKDTDRVDMSVYAWFLNASLSKPDRPRLIEVACPIRAAQGTAVAVVAQEDGWLYVFAIAQGKDDFADVDLVNTINKGPVLEFVRGGEAILVSACADTKDRSFFKDRDRKDRDDHRGKDRGKRDRDDHRGKDRDRDRDDHRKDSRSGKRH